MIYYPDPPDEEIDMSNSGDVHQPRPTLYTLTALEGRNPTQEEWRAAKHMAVEGHALGGLIAALQRGWDARLN